MRADIGIALDGDADRVVIVDEKGHIIDGDQLMAVIAESWQKRGRLAGGGIVATVMSNLGLERYLEEPSVSGSRARRSATATSSSTCASTATMSAASSRAISCCRISRPPATASSRRCSSWRWWRRAASRSARSATASSRCRKS